MAKSFVSEREGELCKLDAYVYVICRKRIRNIHAALNKAVESLEPQQLIDKVKYA